MRLLLLGARVIFLVLVVSLLSVILHDVLLELCSPDVSLLGLSQAYSWSICMKHYCGRLNDFLLFRILSKWIQLSDKFILELLCLLDFVLLVLVHRFWNEILIEIQAGVKSFEGQRPSERTRLLGLLRPSIQVCLLLRGG